MRKKRAGTAAGLPQAARGPIASGREWIVVPPARAGKQTDAGAPRSAAECADCAPCAVEPAVPGRRCLTLMPARPYRAGVGSIFMACRQGEHVGAMPAAEIRSWRAGRGKRSCRAGGTSIFMPCRRGKHVRTVPAREACSCGAGAGGMFISCRAGVGSMSVSGRRGKHVGGLAWEGRHVRAGPAREACWCGAGAGGMFMPGRQCRQLARAGACRTSRCQRYIAAGNLGTGGSGEARKLASSGGSLAC